MECKLNALYVCVRSMDRAIAFYEALLERPVAVRDEIYSVFDIDGFRLGLFAFEKMHEKHVYGNNCLASLSFENAQVLRRKLQGQSVVFPLQKIGANWVSEVEDSEGNALELTAPVGPEE